MALLLLVVLQQPANATNKVLDNQQQQFLLVVAVAAWKILLLVISVSGFTRNNITSKSNYCWALLLLTEPATALSLMLSRSATAILNNSCWCRQCSNITVAGLISTSNSMGKAAAAFVKSRQNLTFSYVVLL